MLCPSVAALLFSTVLQADTGAGAADSCCAALSASPIRRQVVYPESAAYGETISSYSFPNVALAPACVVQPQTAEDVSTALSTLVQKDGSMSWCRFAIKGGGHTVWAGAAGIEDGVTIDLSLMNEAVYHPENKTASLQPGGRWRDVYSTLKKDGISVTGGRTGSVGVSGFLLGGGNSFFAARFGLACDNIVNYQVVLANGDIVNANSETNPDLFKALKGGSNNFGIVTRFDMKTFPYEDIWGGMVSYDVSTSSQQIPAIVRFTDNVHKDPYASLIGTWGYVSAIGMEFIVHGMHYTQPVEYPAAFGDFYQISNMSSTARYGSMRNFSHELEQDNEHRNVFMTSTYLNNAKVLEKAVELHKHILEEAKANAKSKFWRTFSIVQPWTSLMAEHTSKTDGNVLGLERFDQNMIQILFNYCWDDEADDELFQRLVESAIEQLDGYAKMLNAATDFVYLNYADASQNPLKGYGEENLRFMRRVSNEYDPYGVFQYQVPGGFKISKAH